MTNRAIVSLSLSALMLGGSVVGCAAGGEHVATASDAAPKAAAALAGRASKALAQGHADDAVRYAEQAVADRPQLVEYRVLLGQSYLKAGRFTSAQQAFGDVLKLDPANGKAALNMALAQIGTGNWSGARAALDAYARVIPAADRGLAMALAGDPAGAVEVLTAAARTPEADVKTRQNLALALALAGHWPEAKAVAGADLSPADLDVRMTQWAAFSHPAGAADQVSALLGVVPVVDAGQPVALALSAPVPVEAQPETRPVKVTVTPAPAPVSAPTEAVADAPPRFEPAAADVAVRAGPIETAAVSRPVAAPAVANRTTVHGAAAAHPAPGSWYVQIGAFQNAAVARDGWMRAVRRNAAFRGHVPEGMTFRARAGQVYRLSVGGFSRGQADAMCRSYRARGGACFVRTGAGDQVAQWVRKDVQLASR
ncbi:MAG: tetratricopeptide repeat protein [Janthinobacterium lividum]